MFTGSSVRAVFPLLGALGLLFSLRGAGDAAERAARSESVRIRIVATARTEGELAPCG